MSAVPAKWQRVPANRAELFLVPRRTASFKLTALDAARLAPRATQLGRAFFRAIGNAVPAINGMSWMTISHSFVKARRATSNWIDHYGFRG